MDRVWVRSSIWLPVNHRHTFSRYIRDTMPYIESERAPTFVSAKKVCKYIGLLWFVSGWQSYKERVRAFFSNIATLLDITRDRGYLCNQILYSPLWVSCNRPLMEIYIYLQISTKVDLPQELSRVAISQKAEVMVMYSWVTLPSSS